MTITRRIVASVKRSGRRYLETMAYADPTGLAYYPVFEPDAASAPSVQRQSQPARPAQAQPSTRVASREEELVSI